jgi:hypothetical protein
MYFRASTYACDARVRARLLSLILYYKCSTVSRGRPGKRAIKFHERGRKILVIFVGRTFAETVLASRAQSDVLAQRERHPFGVRTPSATAGLPTPLSKAFHEKERADSHGDRAKWHCAARVIRE